MSSQVSRYSRTELPFKPTHVLVSGLAALLYLAPFLSAFFDQRLSVFLQVIILALVLTVFLRRIIAAKITRIQMLVLVYIYVFTFFSLNGAFQQGFFASLISSIVFAKMFIIWALASHVKTEMLKPAMSTLAILQITGVLITIVSPDYFEGFLRVVSYNRDGDRFSGFLLNANKEGAIAGLLAIYYVFVERKYSLAGVFFIILIFTQSRSLALLTFMILSYLGVLRNGNNFHTWMFILFALLAGAFGFIYMFDVSSTFEKVGATVFDQGLYIRVAMLVGGVALASEFFPFGAGGGTFGSSLSLGSPAYDLVGIGHWPTVTEMTGIFDSGIGAILGEYGFFGLTAYSIFLLLLFRYTNFNRLGWRHCYFLMAAVLFMSFFRTVASDAFYAFYFIALYQVFRCVLCVRGREIRMLIETKSAQS